MMLIGETGVSVLAFAGMLPLTLGLVALVVFDRAQIKVHALSLAGMGPLILLVSSPLWADGRMMLTALVLSAALLLTTAISAHAIMRLVAARERSRAEEPDDPPEPGTRAPGETGRE